MSDNTQPWYLVAQVVAAFVTSSTSLVVAFFSFFTARSNQRDVERLRADLADRNAQRHARLEYEFEARKRLYQECGPPLFELSELAERALGRIVGLARTAANGNLGDDGRSWLGRGYYRRSTYYRLLAPLAMGKLLSAKLTHLDYRSRTFRGIHERDGGTQAKAVAATLDTGAFLVMAKAEGARK